MKKLLSLMLIILFTAGVTGCVRYYRTKDIKKNLSRIISDSNKITSRMNKDYSKKRMIYYRITKLIPDKAIKPYPELARELIEMGIALNETSRNISELKNRISKFRSAWEGKKKIKSDSPAWKALTALRDEITLMSEENRKTILTYNQSSKRFSTLAEEHTITEVNTKKLEKPILNYTKRMNRTLKEGRKKIDLAYADLDSAIKIGMDSSRADSKRTILEKIQNLLDEVESENNELLKLLEDIRREAGSAEKFWSGPGMKSHEAMLKIKEKTRKIDQLERDINRESSEYRK